jgi:multiple sugar transport system ATP-binding protein
MAEVVLSHISKKFGSVTAISDVSLTIGNGEFIVLLGPTGAGKTTLLRLVAGLETADAGTISIGGFDATKSAPSSRDVAFVFQQYSLYPHLTVFENLAFPLRSPIRNMSEDDITAKVKEIAGLLRIEDKLQNRATQLSGGQMQRVAIGRALVRSPSIYLMDEPLSSLDAKLRGDLRVELKRIQHVMGATVLYVTHDQMEAMTLATRIGVMKEGHLVQVGTPREIYTDPVDLYVASRLGTPSINLLPSKDFQVAGIPNTVHTIGLRTEHLQIRKGKKGSFIGTVNYVEHLGDQDYLHISINGHELVTLSNPDDGLSTGDEVSLEFVNALYFDRAGNRVHRGKHP